MFRFIIPMVFAMAHVACFAASSSSAASEATIAKQLAIGHQIRTMAMDYVTISTKYADALKEKEIQDSVSSSLPPDVLRAVGDRIGVALEAFSTGIVADSNRWFRIALGAQEWLTNLRIDAQSFIPTDLLNALLEFRLTQEEDYKALKYRQKHMGVSTPLSHLPLNEHLQKNQLEDLEAIWHTIFPYANPRYQEDYKHASPAYVGTGAGIMNRFTKAGKTVEEYIDPSVKYGVELELIQKRAGATPHKIHIVTPIGDKVTIPVATKVVIDSIPYDPTGVSDLKDLIVTFPSGLHVRLSRLVPHLAEGMLNQYHQVMTDTSKILGKKALQQKRAEAVAAVATTTASAHVDEEADYMNTLTPAELEAYIETGKKPDRSATPSAAAPKKGKEAKVAKNAAASDTRAETPAGGSGGAASGTLVTAIEPALSTVRPIHFDSSLKATTLRLADQQALEPLPPLSLRTHVKVTRTLSDDNRAMLANLLKLNKDNKFGAAKTTNTYNWDNLVHLMNQLGFTISRNATFTYDEVRRINLHYIHYAQHTLNDTLISIWKAQLANIGFTKEYLEGLLGS